MNVNVDLNPGTTWWVREPMAEGDWLEKPAQLNLVTGILVDARDPEEVFVYTANEDGLGCWPFETFVRIARSANRVSESQR